MPPHHVLPSLDAIPEGDPGIRMLLGILMGQMQDMRHEYQEGREETQKEHRKVHDILDASGESMRNLTRDVAEIKPIVKDYELKAAFINDTIVLAKEYRYEKAERAGMRKLVGYLIGALSFIGGIVAFGVSELIKYAATHSTHAHVMNWLV